MIDPDNLPNCIDEETREMIRSVNQCMNPTTPKQTENPHEMTSPQELYAIGLEKDLLKTNKTARMDALLDHAKKQAKDV